MSDTPSSTPKKKTISTAKNKKNTFDSKPFKAATNEVEKTIKKKKITPGNEFALSQGQSEILAALQNKDFPVEKWSMIQPYIHMEYIGLFGTPASFKHEQATIFEGLETDNDDAFEKLFFSTKQEIEDPLASMQDYFADRNVIAAIKDISIVTETINDALMTQRKISLAFDIFDVNALTATRDSPPEERFLRALLTLGTSFKLRFGYPPESMEVEFPDHHYFKKNYNNYFSKNPFYEMIVTNYGIPNISIDQKGILSVKIDFLETSNSYIKGGKNSQAILNENEGKYRTTFKEIEEFLKEITEFYKGNKKTINFGDVINIIFKGRKGDGYYKLPIEDRPSKDPSAINGLEISYSLSNPLAGMIADTSLSKFPVPIGIFCQKISADKKDFEVPEEKKTDPEYISRYYPLSRLLSLLAQLTFNQGLIYYLGKNANCAYLTANIYNKTEEFDNLYLGKEITDKNGKFIRRDGGLKPKVDKAVEKAYGGSVTSVRLVYTLVGNKLYFIDLNRRLYIMFKSAGEKEVSEMAQSQGDGHSYLPIIYLNHENTIVSNFNLSMIENSELMNRTAGIILNDGYFGRGYSSNNKNLFYAEVLMRQGNLEMKGLPFIEPYTGICIVGPKPLNRILGNYLITGVTHSISQGSFKTTLDVLGIEVYGAQKKPDPPDSKKYNDGPLYIERNYA